MKLSILGQNTKPTFSAIIGASPSGGTRNDFEGVVGFTATPNANITITKIGRWIISGNNQSHTLYILSGDPGSPTILGSVTINASGATAGQFLYGTLSTPIVVTSGTILYVISDETAAIDIWFDTQPFTFSTDFTSPAACYGGITSIAIATAGNSFVPVNIIYTKP